MEWRHSNDWIMNNDGSPHFDNPVTFAFTFVAVALICKTPFTICCSTLSLLERSLALFVRQVGFKAVGLCFSDGSGSLCLDSILSLFRKQVAEVIRQLTELSVVFSTMIELRPYRA